MIESRVRLAAGFAAAVGVVGLTALAAPASATAAPAAPSAKAAACDRAPWEASVQGSPHGFSAGSRGGDYLWHDSSGFHLRVTHKGDHRAVYTGVVTASAPMRIDPVRLEKGDVVKLSGSRRTLTFAFADYGRIDGVDFHTDCASALHVSRLHVGNANLPKDRVYLGARKSHPKAVPFTVHRHSNPA